MSGGGEPLLSSEETDALLDAMREGSSDAKSVEGVDLASPERRLRRALAPADRSSTAFAAEAQRIMLRYSGASSEVDTLPAEVAAFGVMASGITPGAAITALEAKDGSFALLVVGPSLVSFLLDRSMGAPLPQGETDEAEEATGARAALSPVDRRVLKAPIEELVASLGQCWCQDESALRVKEILPNVASLPDIPQFAPVLRVAWVLNPRVVPADEITLALSPEAVAATSAPEAESSTPVASRFEQRVMGRRIQATHVDLVAVLGNRQITLRDALELSAGDIVRLDSVPGEPTRVHAGGVEVFVGKPVVRHGNLAIEVRSTR